jgi:hydroxyacylglutathione hydrolase
MTQIKETKDFAHVYIICRFDCCYIIDPSHDIEAIQEALGSKKLLGILLTHAHSDHVDLIHHFDVPIYLHLDDAHLLFEDQYNGYAPKRHPYQRKNLNLKYVKHLDQIPIADQSIEVYHTPGHTKGSVCYLYDNKLFTGDTLFKESVGRHDLYSGSLPMLKRSVIMLSHLQANIKIYPGHDAPSTIRNELKNNPFIVKWKQQYNK